MPHQPAAETAVSAPGKVLFTGGYLVLDRNYTGTVVALDARIHIIVQQLQQGRRSEKSKTESNGEDSKHSQGDGEQPADGETEEVVTVRSPQFIDAVWEYRIQRTEQGGGVKVLQINDGFVLPFFQAATLFFFFFSEQTGCVLPSNSRPLDANIRNRPPNPFVETSLNYALTYASYVSASRNFGSLSVTILADNDYYSETAAAHIPQANPGGFTKFGVKLQEAHKTGLGSSAALVTALVSAIVIHRTVQPEELPAVRGKLHNLAQAAHCAAQGKVGSGFDVGAAVYGSCIYRRFSPSVLSSLGDVGSPKFEDRLFSVVEDVNSDSPWDVIFEDVGFKPPRGIQMVLCDVDCGSQTPGMVKKVLEWRNQNRQEADMIWNELQENNDKLRLELQRLTQNRATSNDLEEVRSLIYRSRLWIKTMTKKSGVPIEPLVQTELLDRLGQLDGVIGGVVPGAGGYDAIALLVQDSPAMLERLNGFLENWHSTVEDDFGGKIGKVRLLGVGHGSEGLKNELVVRYCGWL